MKIAAATLLLGTLLATSAHAAMPYAPAPAAATRYTCEGRGLSRIAATTQPAPCCTGMLGCPQLLANTGLIKPGRPNRT